MLRPAGWTERQQTLWLRQCALTALLWNVVLATQHNCKDGTSPSTWSPEKQDICCITEGIGCPEPPGAAEFGSSQRSTPQPASLSIGLPTGGAAAAAPQPSSSSSSLGGVYDCNDGTPPSGWSADKQDICCVSEGIGCPEPPGATVRPATSVPAVVPSTNGAAAPQTVPQTTQPAPQSERDIMFSRYPWLAQVAQRQPSYDCSNPDDLDTTKWGPFHRHYCCRTKNISCAHHVEGSIQQNRQRFVFNCQSGLEDWLTQWSVEKRAWCCYHWGLGCSIAPEFSTTTTTTYSAPYNCEVGVTNRMRGWSTGKAAWCCKNIGVGCDNEESDKNTPFNCEAGLANFQSEWSDAHQGWCCEHWEHATSWPEGTASYCCNLVGRGCQVHKATGGITSKDCQVGLNDWQNQWLLPKKEFCCKHFEAVGQWPLDTGKYCCMYNLACPAGHGDEAKAALFDCEAGNSPLGWSEKKKSWCCQTYGRGCPESHVAHSTKVVSRNTSTTTTTTTAGSGGSEEWSPSYDCRDGPSFGWSRTKKEWCCRREQRGCAGIRPVSAPPGDEAERHCDEGYETWRTSWSDSKKEWCCRHAGRGCPGSTTSTTTTKFVTAFDCNYGYANWQHKWSREKMDWCCDNAGVGCLARPEVPAAPKLPDNDASYDCLSGFSLLEIKQQSPRVKWCCAKEGRGCPIDESAAAKEEAPARMSTEDRCKVDLDTWQTSWGVDKKVKCCEQWEDQETWPHSTQEFCCLYKKIGCPGARGLHQPDRAHHRGGSQHATSNSTANRGDAPSSTTGTTSPARTDGTTPTQALAPSSSRPPSSADASEGSPQYQCDVGVNDWLTGWSDDKKAWCCKHTGFPCPRSHASTTSPSPAKPSPSPSPSKQRTTPGSGSLRTPPRPYDCHDGGAPSSPEEAIDRSEQKYDCQRDLYNWTRAWSSDKKEWCCSHDLVYCPDSLKDSQEVVHVRKLLYPGWSVKKQEWCCMHENIGCPGDDDFGFEDKFLQSQTRGAASPGPLRPHRALPTGSCAAALVAGLAAAASALHRLRAGSFRRPASLWDSSIEAEGADSLVTLAS